MRPSPVNLLRASAVLGACLLAASAAAAQEKKARPAEQPWSVTLPVTVLDAQDRPVADLRPEDFRVLEGGVPQTVVSAERLEGPLAFGLAVDNSGSLRSLLDSVIGFGRLLVEGSGRDSAGFTIRFVGSDRIQLTRDFTTNKAALGAALDEMYVEGGQTAINDALYLAAEHIAEYKGAAPSPRRYSLVLFTDGEDRDSHYKTEQVIEKLRALGVPVFVVGFTEGAGYRKSPESARRYMERLAAETGGGAYFYERKTDPAELARRVLQGMGAGYRVVYTPANQKRDKSFRKVEVTVSAGAGGEARRAFTKEGYVPPQK